MPITIDKLVSDDFVKKNDSILRSLETLKQCKEDLEKAGIMLNENLQVDEKKWDAYFGL